MKKSPPKILVVDDQPATIKLLVNQLEKAGMETISTTTGEECLEIARNTPPDLILLDIVLPGIDGIETCRKLKEIPETNEIPIIFISVKSDISNKLEGLEAGGYDYITKPIDPNELLARVQTQLRIRAINRENIELQRHLSEARQAATLGAVTQGVAHNINNLLGIALGYMDLIKIGPDDAERLKRNLYRVELALKRLSDIVSQLNTISSEYRPRMANRRIIPLLRGTIRRFSQKHKIIQGIELKSNISDSLRILTSEEALESAIEKLLLNAIESYNPCDTKSYKVDIEAFIDEDTSQLCIHIKDQGRGIQENLKNSVFEPFVSTKPSVGHGLGLTMAKHAVKQLGGTLTIQPNPEGGTCVIISHPVDIPTPNFS